RRKVIGKNMNSALCLFESVESADDQRVSSIAAVPADPGGGGQIGGQPLDDPLLCAPRSVEPLHDGRRWGDGRERWRCSRRPVDDCGIQADAFEDIPQRKRVAGGKLGRDALDRRNQSPYAEADAARQYQKALRRIASIQWSPIGEPPRDAMAKR